MNLDSAGVIDIGSARVKLLVARRISGGTLFSRFKSETGTAGKLTNAELPLEAISSLNESIDEMVKVARRENCETLTVIATEVFRTARNGRVAIQDLSRTLRRPITLLSPSQEALLFRRGVAGLFQQSFFLLDVGGGSVQATWGDGDDDFCSIPTGTFRLEKDFQKSSPPAESEYSAMRESIARHAARALPSGLHERTVIFGSNCIDEFLQSALIASSGGDSMSEVNGLHITTLTRLAALLNELEGRPYDTLARYYPTNPMFMRGADKALLNVVVIGMMIGARDVIPTDESLGTSIARLMLSQAPELSHYAIAPRAP